MSNLAGVLRVRGKHAEADTLERRALDGREKELGEQHPDKLTSNTLLISCTRCVGTRKQQSCTNEHVMDA